MAYTEANLNYYKKNPKHITSNLDNELLLELIDFDAGYLRYVNPQTPDLIYAAYDKDPSVFKYVDFSKVSIQFLERVVSEYPVMVQHIYSPSPDIMKLALSRDLNVLPYIEKYLDEDMYEWLLAQNGLILEFIPAGKQTENMVMIALNENVISYQYAHIKTEATDTRLIELDPTKTAWLGKYWSSLATQLVAYNPKFITRFYNVPEIITDEIMKLAIDGEPMLYRTFPNPSLEVTKYAIDAYVDILEYIPYDQEIIDYAISVNGLALKYVKKKDLKTIKDAIAQNVHALSYVEYPRDFLIDYAFSLDGTALRFVVNPNYTQCLDAVKRNPLAIEFVPDELMTKELQLYALMGGVKIVPLITNPVDDEVILQILRTEPSYIFKIDEPTTEMFITAFGSEGRLILFYHRWNIIFNDDIITAALGHDGSILEFVKDKTKSFAMVAIDQFPPAIQWMEHQDIEMARLAINGDPRTLYFVNKDVLDEELLDLAIELDPDYFTRTEGELTWDEWIELTGL